MKQEKIKHNIYFCFVEMCKLFVKYKRKWSEEGGGSRSTAGILLKKVSDVAIVCVSKKVSDLLWDSFCMTIIISFSSIIFV
jgi:hypothetical protein